MKTKRAGAFFKLLIPVTLLALATLACGLNFSSRNPAPPVVVTLAPVQQVETQVPAAAPAVPDVPKNVVDEQTLLVDLYKHVNPSVVSITIYAQHSGQVLPLAQGSGWVYDNDRHIVTNAHVVQDAEQIEVTFSDGDIVQAKLVGADLNADLAVIQVDQLPAGVGPLPLADMSSLEVGETVIAVGNPFGYSGTLTRGVISGLGREIPALTQFRIPQSIQTDAAINPGNSGGPLLNLQGQVIGVNAQIETGGTAQGNIGIGFAIPVSVVQRTVPDLIKNGKTDWSYLGVRGYDLTPNQAQAIGLTVDRGAYITDVTAGGPAEKAAMRGSSGTKTVNGRQEDVGGDVVIEINGQKVESFDDLLVYTALQTRPGQTVTLTILRDGKTENITLVTANRPVEAAPTQTP